MRDEKRMPAGEIEERVLFLLRDVELIVELQEVRRAARIQREHERVLTFRDDRLALALQVLIPEEIVDRLRGDDLFAVVLTAAFGGILHEPQRHGVMRVDEDVRLVNGDRDGRDRLPLLDAVEIMDELVVQKLR